METARSETVTEQASWECFWQIENFGHFQPALLQLICNFPNY
ncbi:hypothetical protein GXM_09444 [Nostoc sphaeroides CCNUC1]|uniref:Uncharacterized protein n=1 Tax=Nostoc sphaeroides CCNUC1 TaxID=2653204 RepID=A0A5P8WH64_9NOSO|nr:hypothetical protein GXM_09444 [Nostoc sphaeroides CCNUC1]